MQTDKQPAVNVGLIGLGFAGTHLHLPPLLQNPRARIVQAADSDPDKVAAFHANHPHLKIETTTTWQDVVINPEVQAVFICTPTPTHREITMAALKEGKHVMCEKPVALTLKDAEDMLAASRSFPDKVVMIGQVLRFWDDYIQAHELVKHGRIGEPRVARASRSVAMPGRWFAQEELSGGVIMDLSLHDIDFLVWTMGEVDSVFAQGANCSGSKEPGFIDYAQTQLNFLSGAIAHVEAAWTTTNTYPFTTALEISGTKGMFTMDNSPFLCSLEIFAADQQPVRMSPCEFNAYYHEDAAFLRALQSGQRAPVSIEDVIHPLQVVLAAKRSIKTGEVVAVSSVKAEVGAAS